MTVIAAWKVTKRFNQILILFLPIIWLETGKFSNKLIGTRINFKISQTNPTNDFSKIIKFILICLYQANTQFSHLILCLLLLNGVLGFFQNQFAKIFLGLFVTRLVFSNNFFFLKSIPVNVTEKRVVYYRIVVIRTWTYPHTWISL